MTLLSRYTLTLAQLPIPFNMQMTDYVTLDFPLPKVK